MTVPAEIPAGDLLTRTELGVWARATIAADDEFATKTISGASLVVRLAAKHAEWTYDDAPEIARLIAAQLAKRSYLNPDAVVRSGVGPLSEATVEDYARTMELTPYEREQLEIAGAVVTSDAGQMFIMNMGGAPTPTERTIYVPDLAGTLLPMYESGDVGAP